MALLTGSPVLQVEKAATVLAKDAEGVDRLVAYVCPPTVDVNQLENSLRDEVPSFLVPHLFQPMQQLPTTSHGEVRGWSYCMP